MLDQPLTDHRPLARQHGEDVLGQPGLERQLTQPHGGQGGELGGLEHDGVARREGGREPPAGDGHREVPRHDHADDAERLVERDVDAAGHRDLLAEQPLGRRAVVGQDVADVARLPAGVPDRVPGVAHLELGQFLQVVLDLLGEAPQQPPAVGRRDLPPRVERPPGPRHGSIGLRDVGERDGGDDLLGGRVDDVVGPVVRRRGEAHNRSNPRKRSQSVTDRPKAASSTAAMLA